MAPNQIHNPITFIKVGEHRPDYKDVPSQVNLPLLRVYYDKCKHAVEHPSRLFGSETNVQVNDDFTVAVRLVVEPVFLPRLSAVIDLSVVEESDVWIGMDSHWLHPVDGIYNFQAMKAQARVGEGWYGLDAECIGTSVTDLFALHAVYLDGLFSAE